MHVEEHVQDLDLFGLDECLNVEGGFIVELVEVREEAPGGKPSVDFFVRAQQFFLGPALDGDGLDVVCVVHVEQCNVRVASFLCDWELPHLVAGDLAHDYSDCHKDQVCPGIGRFLGGVVHVGVNSVGWEDNGHSCSCAPRVAKPLPHLVHVDLGGLD
jgi:hypothetical protein